MVFKEIYYAKTRMPIINQTVVVSSDWGTLLYASDWYVLADWACVCIAYHTAHI